MKTKKFLSQINHERMHNIRDVVDRWRYGVAGVSASDAIKQIKEIIESDDYGE